ncbi:TPA: YSIRK-type signal peptide-containing protein [Streptococcus suis]|nr:YSIRK-type signal peptide-containing protein [Streptococcus suis]
MNRQDKNYQKLYHYSIRKRNWGVGSVVVGVFLAGMLQAPTVLASETNAATGESGIVSESEASRSLREKIAELRNLKDQIRDTAERTAVENEIANAQGALETGQDAVINAYLNHLSTVISRTRQIVDAQPPLSNTEIGEAALVSPEEGEGTIGEGAGSEGAEGPVEEATPKEAATSDEFAALPVPEVYLVDRDEQALADRRVIHKMAQDYSESGAYDFTAEEIATLKNLGQGVLHFDVKVDQIEAGQQVDVFKVHTDDNNFYRIFAFMNGEQMHFGMEGKKDGSPYLDAAYMTTVLKPQLGEWSSLTYLKTGNRTRFFVNGRNSTTRNIQQNVDKLILVSDQSSVLFGTRDSSKGRVTLGDLAVYNNPNVVSDNSGVTDNPLSTRYFKNYPTQAVQPLTIARVAHAGESKDNFVEVFFNRAVAVIGQPDLALENGSYAKFISQTSHNSAIYQIKDADYGQKITGLREREGVHLLFNSSAGTVHLAGVLPRLDKVSVDDNHTSLVFTGSWTSETGQGKFGNTGRYTSGTNDRSVTLYFEGTGVDMYSERHNAHADFLVELDGEVIAYNEKLGLGREGKFSLFIPADQTRQRQERIFTLDQLRAGKHALTLSVDPANANKQLFLDVFELFGENARVLTKDEYFRDLVIEKERLVGLAADSTKVSDAEAFASKQTAFETELAKAVPSIPAIKQALADMSALIVEKTLEDPAPVGDASEEAISVEEARRLLAEYTEELEGYLALLDETSQDWIDYLLDFNGISRDLLAANDNDKDILEQYKEAKANVEMFRNWGSGTADQPSEGGDTGSGDTNTPTPTEGGDTGSGESNTPTPTDGSDTGSGDSSTPAPTEGGDTGSGDSSTPASTEGGDTGSGDSSAPAPTEGGDSGSSDSNSEQEGQGAGLDLAALEEVLAIALALEEEKLSEAQAGQLAELLETAAATRTAENQEQVDEVVALFEEWLSGLTTSEGPADSGASGDTGSQTDSGASGDTGSQTDSGASGDTGSQTDSGASEGTGSQTGSGENEGTGNQTSDNASGTVTEQPSLDAVSVARLRDILSELEGYIPRLAGEEWPAYLNQFRDQANRVMVSGTPTQLASHLAEGEELIELLRGVFAEAEQGNQSAEVTEKGKGLLNEGPKAFDGGLTLNENLTHELPAFDGGVSLNENLIHEVPSFEGGLTLNESLTHQVPAFDGGLVPNYAPNHHLPSMNPASLKPVPSTKTTEKTDMEKSAAKVLPNTAGVESLLLTGMGLMTLGAAVALRHRKEE